MTWDEALDKENKVLSKSRECACGFKCPLHDTYDELVAALEDVLKTMYSDPNANIFMITHCSTTVKEALARAREEII